MYKRQVSLVDSPEGYPLCSISYILAPLWLLTAYNGGVVPQSMRTLKDYLQTALRKETQDRVRDRNYVPVPESILQIARDGVDGMIMRP